MNRVCVKASPAFGWRRFHTNTDYIDCSTCDVLDETVIGWKCHWMKSCLDESVSGWNRFWMKVYSTLYWERDVLHPMWLCHGYSRLLRVFTGVQDVIGLAQNLKKHRFSFIIFPWRPEGLTWTIVHIQKHNNQDKTQYYIASLTNLLTPPSKVHKSCVIQTFMWKQRCKMPLVSQTQLPLIDNNEPRNLRLQTQTTNGRCDRKDLILKIQKHAWNLEHAPNSHAHGNWERQIRENRNKMCLI